MERTVRLTIAVLGLALFNFSAVKVQAQFDYFLIDGTLTIAKYTGPGGNVTIPSETYGLPGTCIGEKAFYDCTSLTNVTLGNSLTDLGHSAFHGCSSLTSVTIGDRVRCIGALAFSFCSSLTNVWIGNSVTNTGDHAFQVCTSLRTVVIPKSLMMFSASWWNPDVFASCRSLTGVFFEGNAPACSGSLFAGATNVTVYYLPGTIGWGTAFGGRPTAPWVQSNPTILTTAPNFGIQNNTFGFRISWATNASVVVEASTTLANPVWSPVSTNTLTDGWSYFSDAEWRNYPARFYRVRSP